MLAELTVLPETTYVRLDPVKFVPDKLTFVKSNPERSVLIKFILGPIMYPRVNPYPDGKTGTWLYVIPLMVAVVAIPPLVIPTMVAFVKFAPVKFVFVSVEFDKFAWVRFTNGPTK